MKIYPEWNHVKMASSRYDQAKIIRNVGNWLLILILILLLGRFAIQTYARMITNSNSVEGDQGAFMQLGLDLREQGTLTDGTRYPLFTAFLAVIARREWPYFTQAKLLSMIFGMLAIAAVFFGGRRFFNAFTGLAAAYLLSINTEFIIHSASVLAESLLILIFVLAWFAMIRALDNENKWLYWAIAGALASFAYLAKGSAQIMVIAFLISTFIIFQSKLFRLKGVWVFLASYALVASPFWIYNTIHFGNPTFNYAMTHQMWMDRWTDFHRDADDELPTVLTYLRSHSVSEIIDREWTGMKVLRNVLVKTVWPTRPLKLDRFLQSPVSGYVLVLLVLLPLIFWRASRRYIRQNRSAVYLTVFTIILFYLLFAWFVPINFGTRFMLPLVPLIMILLANIINLFWQKTARFGGVWANAVLALVVVVLVIYEGYLTIAPARVLLTQNVFEQDRRFGADAAVPLVWLVNESSEPVNIAWGPAGKSLPTWAYSDRLNFQLYPPRIESMPDLTQNLVSRQIDYIVVGPDMISRYGGVLEDQFPSDRVSIKLTNIPTGWALSYAYRDMPCNWCIFRLLESNPPQQTVDYQVGEAIHLVGYDLNDSQFRPGDTVFLTLHWQAVAPMDKDYTVFAQLLGPDFQLHGQLDRQPINNLWPTSRWQPGDRLADRYEISLDVDAPPGEYQLLVGMYLLQTGQRQTITQHGRLVPDNAIRLTMITLARNAVKNSTRADASSAESSSAVPY